MIGKLKGANYQRNTDVVRVVVSQFDAYLITRHPCVKPQVYKHSGRSPAATEKQDRQPIINLYNILILGTINASRPSTLCSLFSGPSLCPFTPYDLSV